MSRASRLAGWFFPPAGAVGLGMRLLRLLPILAMAGLLCFGFWRVFLYNDAARREAANTVVAEERGEAMTNAAEFATDQVVTRYETHRTIDRTVEQGVRNVYHVPQAAETSLVPGLDAAGRSALCMSRSYQRVNDCPGLPQADPAGAEGADPVGDGPGE